MPATHHLTLSLEEIRIHPTFWILYPLPQTPEWTSHKLAEFETSDEELPQSNDPCELLKNEDEWIESITPTGKLW